MFSNRNRNLNLNLNPNQKTPSFFFKPKLSLSLFVFLFFFFFFFFSAPANNSISARSNCEKKKPSSYVGKELDQDLNLKSSLSTFLFLSFRLLINCLFFFSRSCFCRLKAMQSPLNRSTTTATTKCGRNFLSIF